jgi:glycosyltransferase involved in cell wall biosynthesis
MTTIVTHKELRMQMVEKGMTQAAQFSWAQMAKDILSIYYETAAAISIYKQTANG